MNDREAIGELVHRYADGVTRRDVTQWSSCWADEARWTLSDGRAASGRDAIVELLQQVLSMLDGVVQNVLNGAATIEGNTARGCWYIIEHYRRVGSEAGLVLARYDDTYVERDGDWLFTSRTLVTSYHGPPDLSDPFSDQQPLEAGFSQ